MKSKPASRVTRTILCGRSSRRMPRTVLLGFDELLTRLALTQPQIDVAVARHTSLRDFLNSRFKLSKEAWLTGSYSRKTIVRQDRDIDIAAGFSVSEYWNKYEGQS